MDVFQIFKIVQMVTNLAKHHTYYELFHSHLEPSLNEKRSSVSSVVRGSISFSGKEEKRGSSVASGNVSVVSCSDQGTEEGG